MSVSDEVFIITDETEEELALAVRERLDEIKNNPEEHKHFLRPDELLDCCSVGSGVLKRHCSKIEAAHLELYGDRETRSCEGADSCGACTQIRKKKV